MDSKSVESLVTDFATRFREAYDADGQLTVAEGELLATSIRSLPFPGGEKNIPAIEGLLKTCRIRAKLEEPEYITT